MDLKKNYNEYTKGKVDSDGLATWVYLRHRETTNRETERRKQHCSINTTVSKVG